MAKNQNPNPNINQNPNNGILTELVLLLTKLLYPGINPLSMIPGLNNNNFLAGQMNQVNPINYNNLNLSNMNIPENNNFMNINRNDLKENNNPHINNNFIGKKRI